MQEITIAMLESVRQHACLLTGEAADYDALLERIGEARVVLLGEASHGTHESYRERAEITKRLLAEKAFTAVAVEADWPDAYRVNRYVRGVDAEESALAGFNRFPTWMWEAFLDFITDSPYTNWAFRGQCEAAWPLFSALSRYLVSFGVHPARGRSRNRDLADLQA